MYLVCRSIGWDKDTISRLWVTGFICLRTLWQSVCTTSITNQGLFPAPPSPAQYTATWTDVSTLWSRLMSVQKDLDWCQFRVIRTYFSSEWSELLSVQSNLDWCQFPVIYTDISSQWSRLISDHSDQDWYHFTVILILRRHLYKFSLSLLAILFGICIWFMLWFMMFFFHVLSRIISVHNDLDWC